MHKTTLYLILKPEAVGSSETSIMNCQLRETFAPRKNASIEVYQKVMVPATGMER
jgi:hypothetical protein